MPGRQRTPCHIRARTSVRSRSLAVTQAPSRHIPMTGGPPELVRVLSVTRHECRTSLLMNMDRSYEADRNPWAMVKVTLSYSP
jgi:hypothetical protein